MKTVSEKLISDYRLAREDRAQAIRHEEKMVGTRLAEQAVSGLPIWLGDFARELARVDENDWGFFFHPQSNYETDAGIEAAYTWQGMRMELRMSAAKPRGGLDGYLRKLKAYLKCKWGQENLFGETLYQKELFLELPFAEKREDLWVFPQAAERVQDDKLGAFLAQVVEVEQERQAVRQAAENRRAEAQMAIHERKIMHAREDELGQFFENACERYPLQVERWDEAREKRLAEFKKEKFGKQERLDKVKLAAAWLEKWKAVLLANRAVLRKVQAEYEGEISGYILEYGVVALDGGENYVTTEVMYVRDDEVDEAGCWVSLDTKLHRERVMHPVRVVPFACEFSAARSVLKQHLWVEQCLDYIHAATTVDPLELVGAVNEADFQDFPEFDIQEKFEKGIWQEALEQVIGAETNLYDFVIQRALLRVVYGEVDPYGDPHYSD